MVAKALKFGAWVALLMDAICKLGLKTVLSFLCEPVLTQCEHLQEAIDLWT